MDHVVGVLAIGSLGQLMGYAFVHSRWGSHKPLSLLGIFTILMLSSAIVLTIAGILAPIYE